jgi:hypothetical protein
MSQVFAFLLRLVEYARTKDISIPAVAAYDDVSLLDAGTKFY